MKKLYFLIALALLCAVSTNARWIVGAQKGADEIKAGDTIVLATCFPQFAGRYLAGSKLSAVGQITEDNIFVVEAGPQDIRTGATTIYLKRVDNPSRGSGENGYLKYNGDWQTISYDTNKANAANLQIISCDVDIPWSNTYSYDDYVSGLFRDDATDTSEEIASWRNYQGQRASNAKSVGFSYSTSDTEWTYLASWSSADNIWFWRYTDTNQWNIYSATDKLLLTEVISTTQTTAIIRATCNAENGSIKSETIDGQAVINGMITLTGLAPATNYTKKYVVETYSGEKDSVYVSFTTKDISVSFDKTAGATSLYIAGKYDAGDATVIDHGFVDNGGNDQLTVGGLDPATEYTYTYYVTTKEGGIPIYKTVTITTQELELTMQGPKVVSTGNVIVAAESNITDLDEVNIGFEWRRDDWDDNFLPNSGNAYLYEGTIEAYIRDLQTDKLWYARAFYKSASSKSYYSEWVGIDPRDVSYLDPTVHTYARAEVDGNSARIRGYALNGSDGVIEQGFKYKKKSGKTGSPFFPQAGDGYDDAMTIIVTGQSMVATLENLEANTTYSYVAFVKTNRNQTFYGEEQILTTEDPDGIGDITAASPANDDSGSVRVYTLSSKLVYNGAEADMSLDKGIYIIRYSDGKTKKVAY